MQLPKDKKRKTGIQKFLIIGGLTLLVTVLPTYAMFKDAQKTQLQITDINGRIPHIEAATYPITSFTATPSASISATQSGQRADSHYAKPKHLTEWVRTIVPKSSWFRLPAVPTTLKRTETASDQTNDHQIAAKTTPPVTIHPVNQSSPSSTSIIIPAKDTAIPINGRMVIPVNAIVIGDIFIGGVQVFDNNPNTGTLTIFTKATEVHAPHGAYVILAGNGTSRTATQKMLIAEMKRSGCVNGCTQVNQVIWP